MCLIRRCVAALYVGVVAHFLLSSDCVSHRAFATDKSTKIELVCAANTAFRFCYELNRIQFVSSFHSVYIRVVRRSGS